MHLLRAELSGSDRAAQDRAFGRFPRGQLLLELRNWGRSRGAAAS